METFGKVMFVILSFIIGPIISGFVFSQMWSWFVVPVLGVNELTIAQAFGLSLFITYLRGRNKKEESEDDEFKQFINSMLFTVFSALIVLGLGWLITLFI